MRNISLSYPRLVNRDVSREMTITGIQLMGGREKFERKLIVAAFEKPPPLSGPATLGWDGAGRLLAFHGSFYVKLPSGKEKNPPEDLGGMAPDPHRHEGSGWGRTLRLLTANQKPIGG